MNIHSHVKQLEREIKARGLTAQQVGLEAGFSGNLIHTWKHMAKMGEGKTDTKQFNSKRRVSLAKVHAVLSKHKVKYPHLLQAHERDRQLSLPLSKPHQPKLKEPDKGNGHDKGFKTWDPNHGWIEANPPKMLVDKTGVDNVVQPKRAESAKKWEGSQRRDLVLHRRDTACETLQRLIQERLGRMSAVQLALLLAHIAGEG